MRRGNALPTLQTAHPLPLTVPLIPYPILGAAEPALFRIQNTRTPTAHNST